MNGGTDKQIARPQDHMDHMYGGTDKELSRVQEEISDKDLEKSILTEYGFTNEDVSSDKFSKYSPKTSQTVLVKKYRKSLDDDIERAQREITALQAIQNDNISSLIDYFDPADTIFVITSEGTHEPLKYFIEGRGSLSEATLKSVTTQLFSAITSIFMAGFTHLRICDQTLFLDDDAHLLIKDFEFAQPYAMEKVDDLYAAVEDRYSSDLYVAPEAFSPMPYNGRKACLWSCGIAIYYMTTGQLDRLANLEHPVFRRASDVRRQSEAEPRARRRSSLGGRKLSVSQAQNIITYPGTRFEVPAYVRDIVSKMLIVNPLRRAELIEVAAKVPKEIVSKQTRPLMELAWLDYKSHVGPYAGMPLTAELDSSASSMYSGISNMSDQFMSLLGGRRRSSSKAATYTGFV